MTMQQLPLDFSSVNERWRAVPGYQGLYEVSDHGRWEDAIRHGSRIGGQDGHLNPVAKLTLGQVSEIRGSKLSQYKLAKIYGVSPSTIWYARNGQSYRSKP